MAVNKGRTRWSASAAAMAIVGAAAIVQPRGAWAAPQASGAPTSEMRHPLTPLPAPPDIRLPRPTERSSTTVSDLLERLTSEDSAERAAALSALRGVSSELLPALSTEIAKLSSRADKQALKDLLLSIRKKTRADIRASMKAAGRRGKVVTPDYLEMLLGSPQPKSETWRQLVRVVATSRMLGHLGTTAATRELVEIYVRFGEFLRVDTQLQLKALGDRALPALIEAQLHPAPKIAKWARRRLELRGKDVPSEAIQVDDPHLLADILLAYGRTRDPDAARILVSFCNSERRAVREGARQAVTLMGEVANWQLRDTYEKLIGRRPLREWSWDRTARELFTELDRTRLADVHRLFDEGEKALAEQKWAEMKQAFDRVLARSPHFDEREVLTRGYYGFAQARLDDDRQESLDALRRAERLAPDEATRGRVKSLRLTLEAEELLERGIADQVLYRRAIELNPDNVRAKEGLKKIALGEVAAETQVGRYVGAAAILFVVLVALAYFALRRVPPAPAKRGTKPNGDGKPPDSALTESTAAVPGGDEDETKPGNP